MHLDYRVFWAASSTSPFSSLRFRPSTMVISECCHAADPLSLQKHTGKCIVWAQDTQLLSFAPTNSRSFSGTFFLVDPHPSPPNVSFHFTRGVGIRSCLRESKSWNARCLASRDFKFWTNLSTGSTQGIFVSKPAERASFFCCAEGGLFTLESGLPLAAAGWPNAFEGVQRFSWEHRGSEVRLQVNEVFLLRVGSPTLVHFRAGVCQLRLVLLAS